MTIAIGCIADDFTGATDLAGMWVKGGLRTVQMIGVPAGPLPDDVDAVVISLKTRTVPADDAVRQSLAALDALRSGGARQIYFKYCSTFDSTPAGNIGPVGDALLDALGTDFTVVCPAFPANGRTIYKGRLFVGDVPLDESGMRHHPLTPMTDANLARLLAPQTRRTVGRVDHDTVRRGPDAIRERFATLRRDGVGYAVLDALTDDDLTALGSACADLPLVTAGSGLALGIARALPPAAGAHAAARLPRTGGRRAVVSGSCSDATRRQVAAMREANPSFRITPAEAAGSPEDAAARALAWADAQDGQAPLLVYATAAPEEVREAQARFGVAEAGAAVEHALAAVARGLVERGVGRLIVAGGETSGAVVQALGVQGLTVGPEIDPGVPWTTTLGGLRAPLALALKSGNFGTDDFFLKAWDRLDP